MRGGTGGARGVVRHRTTPPRDSDPWLESVSMTVKALRACGVPVDAMAAGHAEKGSH